MTVLDHLLRSLARCAEHNRNDVVAPRAILWTDGERLWEPVIGRLRAVLPRLFTLGDYDAETRTGPAAYLRAQVPAQPPAGTEIPVFYLPGIARTAFRSAVDCPATIRHLFAVQYEGEFWLQKNGKDWTPAAFLGSSDGGLGLDVARDAETGRALLSCLEKVLEAKCSDLSGRRLEAADFRGLVADDPVRMLLRWMGQPAVWRKTWTAAEWTSFRAIAKDGYGFDPEKDGELVAAEKLAAGEGVWAAVWTRYHESPVAFAGVAELMARVLPSGLFVAEERYPEINERRESDLRRALEAVGSLPWDAARKQVLAMALKEEPRRSWAWAKLDRAPLAEAVRHLRMLVQAQEEFAGGKDWDGLAQGYAQRGWEVDRAALRALSVARAPADTNAVSAALRGVYRPWLEQLAQATQALAPSYPNRSVATARRLEPAAGTVFLFVDGLRYDLGSQLCNQLQSKGVKVALGMEWAALPSVTATAKPAWQPLAARLDGESDSTVFEPAEAATHRALTTARFRELLGSLGFDFLKADETGDPARCAWAEVGAFDKHGHAEGMRLAWRVQEQIGEVVHRVESLLAAGWKHIRILTDHGWLMLPGGLPKHDLPRHLTTSKWGRCALPTDGAKHGFPETPWFWDASKAFVLAPGIGCFVEGMEYSHGGLTLQETLLPVLEVSGAAAPVAKVELKSAKWRGLRLAVELEGAAGLLADVRTKAADPTKSVLPEAQRQSPVPADGRLSLLVADDDKLGSAALLILSDPTGRVLFKSPLNIGEN